MATIEHIVNKIIRRSAKKLTAQELQKPHVQKRIVEIIQRTLARHGIYVADMEMFPFLKWPV